MLDPNYHSHMNHMTRNFQNLNSSHMSLNQHYPNNVTQNYQTTITQKFLEMCVQGVAKFRFWNIMFTTILSMLLRLYFEFGSLISQIYIDFSSLSDLMLKKLFPLKKLGVPTLGWYGEYLDAFTPSKWRPIYLSALALSKVQTHFPFPFLSNERVSFLEVASQYCCTDMIFKSLII